MKPPFPYYGGKQLLANPNLLGGIRMTTDITPTTDEYGASIAPVPADEVPDLLGVAYGGWLGALLADDREVTDVLLLGHAPARQLIAAAGLFLRRLYGGEQIILHIDTIHTARGRFVRYLDGSDDEPAWNWQPAGPNDPDAVAITRAELVCGALGSVCGNNLTDIPGSGAALARVPSRGATVRTLLAHAVLRDLPGTRCRICRHPAPCPPAREAAHRIGLDIDPDHYGPDQPCTCRQPACNWHSVYDWGCLTYGCDCRWYPATGGAQIPPHLTGQQS